MVGRLKVYCDTDTLPSNARHGDEKTRAELEAINRLHSAEVSDKVELVGSRANQRELERASDPELRRRLKAEHSLRTPIERDEKYHGNVQNSDQYGGYVSNPLVSDVQDPDLVRSLEAIGVSHQDAVHISQAVANCCDVFMTRDEKTIISKCEQIRQVCSSIAIMLPSEVLARVLEQGLA